MVLDLVFARISIPLLEEHPETSLVLFPIMVSISLGVMNLILAAPRQIFRVLRSRGSHSRSHEVHTGNGLSWDVRGRLLQACYR